MRTAIMRNNHCWSNSIDGDIYKLCDMGIDICNIAICSVPIDLSHGSPHLWASELYLIKNKVYSAWLADHKTEM